MTFTEKSSWGLERLPENLYPTLEIKLLHQIDL